MLNIGDSVYFNDPDYDEKFKEFSMRGDITSTPWEKDENGYFFTICAVEWTEKDNIRAKREEECFPIINRGTLWYSSLSEEQLKELNQWYQAWLNAPETLVVPEKPNWL